MSIIENLIEGYYYLRILISPVLIGIILAVIFYNTVEIQYNAVISFLIVITSFVLGILWANSARKKHGASNYMAMVDSSHDLNNIKK